MNLWMGDDFGFRGPLSTRRTLYIDRIITEENWSGEQRSLAGPAQRPDQDADYQRRIRRGRYIGIIWGLVIARRLLFFPPHRLSFGRGFCFWNGRWHSLVHT